MEERLERVLNRVIDWLKYEEAKNGALVTLNGVGVGVIVQWLSSASAALSPWLKASLVILLLSIIIGLFSFYPVLKDEKLHRIAAQRRARSLTRGTKSKPSVLFFAQIAGSKPEAYLDEFRVAVGEPGGSTPLELDYAGQIVANSEIAVLKLRLFEAAFLFSILAFILVCLGALVNAMVSLTRA